MKAKDNKYKQKKQTKHSLHARKGVGRSIHLLLAVNS